MNALFNNTGTYEINGEEKSFNFKTTLNAVERMSFVDGVVKTIINDTYEYIIRDMMFDYIVIRMFTDVDCSEIEECEHAHVAMNMIEDLVYGTSIASTVKLYAGEALLNELNKAIDYSIQVKTGIVLNPASDILVSILKLVEEKLASYDNDGITDMVKLFSGMDKADFNVNAALQAYANSDAFKAQQKVLQEAAAERAEKLDAIKEA